MTPKLTLFPAQTTISAGGRLVLAGHQATDLAARFGTPLYVYHVDTIRRQIAAYRQALAAYPGPTRLTYASKAFLCAALARLMADQGVGLDVASAGELFMGRQGGVKPVDMHLHGNNKSTRDLTEALQAGVGQIVVDNAAELDRLAGLAHRHGQRVNIWLRVTPNVAVETHHRYTVTGAADSKFGFPLTQVHTAAARLLETPTSPLQLTGLHLHLGSHFHEAGPVAQALARLLDLAASLRESHGWQMSELSPGGGWGVPYHPTDPPMPLEPFVAGLVQAVTQGCRQRNLPLPELVLEPGRSLVAQAGVALYTVGGRKALPGGRVFVAVDGGLADNPRPAMYGARYTALLANRAAEPETETVAVAGPFCESGDILIDAVDLPPAAPGDILAVPVAGAYHLSMSSNYNGFLRPAVVFIDGPEARLVQRRETFEDLIRREV
jgi:diaminopimelate decarboxylase